MNRKVSTRENILAISRDLYVSLEAHPTMDEVAVAAGVSRATLYRHFNNRDELLLTVLEEEALQIAGRVEKRIRPIESPGEYIVEGMVQAMAEIQKSDLIHGIFQTDITGTVNRLLFDTDRLTNIGIAIMQPVVARASDTGELNTTLPPELLVEWILRMLISLITVPSKQLKTHRAVRELLRATMLPVLEK